MEEQVNRIEETSSNQANIQDIMDNILCGDARDLLHQAPDNFKLLLIDPPY